MTQPKTHLSPLHFARQQKREGGKVANGVKFYKFFDLLTSKRSFNRYKILNVEDFFMRGTSTFFFLIFLIKQTLSFYKRLVNNKIRLSIQILPHQ